MRIFTSQDFDLKMADFLQNFYTIRVGYCIDEFFSCRISLFSHWPRVLLKTKMAAFFE
jgi:hypothetical protein